MNRKRKHLDKFLQEDQLPTPDVPANEAWEGMNQLLDAAGAAANGAGTAKWAGQIWKSLGTLKGMVITSAAVIATSAVVVISISNNTQDMQTTPASDPTVVAVHSPAPRETHGLAAPDALPEEPQALADSIHAEAKTREIDPANSGTTSARSEKGTTGNARATQSAVAANAKLPKTQTPIFSQNTNTEAHQTSRQNATRPSPDPTRRPGNESTSSTTVLPTISPEATSIQSTEKKTINSLIPRPARFATLTKTPAIRFQQGATQPPAEKVRKDVLENIHFGPEWSMSFMDINSPYLLTGADSIKRLARLAVPGIFITKSWNRHAVTFTFTPLHAYHGNKDLVRQQSDTTFVSDSIFTVRNHNVHFYKAVGMNFALQYQFETTPWLSLAAGMSYSAFSGALFRRDLVTSTGAVVNGQLLSAKSREAIGGLINPNQWAVRAGIIMHPGVLWNGRLQIGSTAIIPVSTLTPYADRPKKWLNAQIFLRLLIR